MESETDNDKWQTTTDNKTANSDLSEVDVKNDDTENSDENTSSFENIIPFKNLKNGWFAVTGLLSQTAKVISEKAVETYNSESMQSLRQKSADTIVPAWEKTCEVATPVWNKTVEVTTPVWENTKSSAYAAATVTQSNVNIAAEKVAPTINTVTSGASAGWKTFTDAAFNAGQYAGNYFGTIEDDDDDDSSKNANAKGEVMTV